MEQLHAFAQGAEGLQAPRLVRRPGLVAEVQARLAHHGLLDPPAVGLLGPGTQWALGGFCRAAGLPFDGALIPAPPPPPIHDRLGLRGQPTIPYLPDLVRARCQPA